MSKQNRSLEFLSEGILNFPFSSLNINFDRRNNTAQDHNAIPNLISSLISNVAHNILDSENRVRNPIVVNIEDLPIISTFLSGSHQRKPPTFYDSESSGSLEQKKRCPPMLPKDEIESIIEPRNAKKSKTLKSHADRVRAMFSNPSVEKKIPAQASDENKSGLLSQTQPTFLHYSACLPNPQFFKSAKLESVIRNSSKALRKINEYRKTPVKSTLNPSSLKKAPSNKVANSSKPVNLGRASRFLIRSIDSIHDTEGQRTDHFFADSPHNKATRGEEDPRVSSKMNREVQGKQTSSGDDKAKIRKVREKMRAQVNSRTKKLLDARLLNTESKDSKQQERKRKKHLKIQEKFREGDQREQENSKTDKKKITNKKHRTKKGQFPRNKLRCVVLGWGQTALFGPGSDVLRHAKVPILSASKCEEVHTALNMTENMLCAGDLDASKDTCKGDSGGPLLCEDRKDGEKVHWVVVGVTSFGVGCGQLGVYTNVHRYTDWIKDTIRKPFN
ncbi:Serine proteases trypsin domain [Trinorchestia longiramus]|nr:Serine proteases trypsin domain [Trinorchestia longiramus]